MLELFDNFIRIRSTVKSGDCNTRTFIYLFYLFPEFRMQHYSSKTAEYTIQYMHTWILKDECVATYIAPIKHTRLIR